MRISVKRFSELSAFELYDILRLRAEVFIVEQGCAYQDLDGLDAQSWHLRLIDPNQSVLAYARVLPPGLKYDEWSFGRVLSPLAYRGRGYGREMIHAAIQEIDRLGDGRMGIRISAQSYLIDFYSEYGFTPVGLPYLEDRIPHQQMLRERVDVVGKS